MFRFEPLGRSHGRKEFHCGVQALDAYLVVVARQHAEKGVSRTFVAVDEGQPERIRGYFTLTVTEIDYKSLPQAQRRRMPKGGLPMIKLARLAVDRAFQGQGMGEILLIEALRRAEASQALTGSVAVAVEAKDETAAGFYAKYGFVAAPDNALLLFMGFRAIRTLISEA